MESHQDKTILLSIIIICHNQKDVVKRCIDSVLQQKTSFGTEVIVSDDRSTDGTREMLITDYKDKVIPTFFDSDKCNTNFTLERAGYNRLNGLKLAKGKYIIHTDGDDFFTSTDLFQTMVDTLEAHPECSLCCQNYCKVSSENVNVPHVPQIKNPILEKEGIISAQSFFENVNFLVNSCYCARRGENFNSNNLWGGTYDDNYITARYIGKGQIAILNRCDFVYVMYGHSTCATMSKEDKNLLFKAPVVMAELAPSVAGALLKRYTMSFYRVSKHVLLRRTISNEINTFYKNFDSFITHNLKNDISFIIWARYALICFLSALMVATKYKPKLLLRLLYRLAIGKISEKVVI